MGLELMEGLEGLDGRVVLRFVIGATENMSSSSSPNNGSTDQNNISNDNLIGYSYGFGAVYQFDNLQIGIIYGNDNPEILLDEIEDEAVEFNFKFTNCLIRFEDNNNNFTGPNYDLTDITKYEGNIFNEDPNFLDTELNKLIIGDDSAAINQGLAAFATQVPFDILNVSRTSSPDLGAYQHITFPEDEN